MSAKDLEAHHLYCNLTRLWLIKFYKEHPLELSKKRVAIDHWNNFRSAEDHVLTMGVTVRTFVRAHAYRAKFEVVVTVVCVLRSTALEEVFHVLQKEWLVLVDHYGERGVGAVNRNLTVLYTRL